MPKLANHRWEVLCLTRKKTLKRLLSYLSESKYQLVLALFTALIANLLALYAPKVVGQAIDAIGVKNNVDFMAVYKYAIILLIMYLVSSLFLYILQRLLIIVSNRITYRLRKEIFDHLQDLPISYFDQNQTGDIISKISYDVDTINTSLSTDILHLFTGFITAVGSFVMMFMISNTLVIVVLVTVPVVFYIAKLRMHKVKPLFRLRSRKLGELNGFSEEMLSGAKTIKAYGQEDTMIAKYDEKDIEASDAYYNADYQGSILGPSINGINNLSLSLISMFGTILFVQGKLSIGAISSFVMYSRKFAGPINETAGIITEIQTAITAAERVFRLLDESVEKEDDTAAIELTDIKGEVRFDHVSFGYDPKTRIIFDLNLQIAPGKLFAIVGPTGAGKTTIINLLMRFYDVDEGQIFIDDIPINMIKRQSLRQAFAMVLQESWLFEGTIAENVAYANMEATTEEIINVCKKAHIHNYIDNLPDGYNTILTDNAVNLSKGQKQLLTIARAMLSPAKMLILDEATSNVDSNTEIQIQKAMLELMKDKTSFVIAHRLSTIKTADQILVLDHGKVIETGNHDELIRAKGFYANLFNAQFTQ